MAMINDHVQRHWVRILIALAYLTAVSLNHCHASADTVTPRPCDSRRFGEDKTVCVCNSTYCDDLPPVSSADAPVGSFLSYRSSQTGDRYFGIHGSFSPTESEENQKSNVDVVFTISNTGSNQQIIGFGGAFTDAAAINILSLSDGAQDNLLKSYYSPTGSEYTMGRVPMAGCDFSTHVYSYDESAGDFDLKNFSLTKEDIKMKIPLILRAQDVAGRHLQIFASPWSAPGWMKTSGSMNSGGRLIGDAGNNYHKTWAQYFVKFIQSYEAENVMIWGLTAQNEPIDGNIPKFPFQALGFTPSSQRDFIAKDLGPALEAAGLRRVKLMIMDDQRFLLPNWADTVLADPNASQYVDGIGVHWYFDFLTPSSVLTKTHNNHPDKFLLNTEACEGSLSWQTKVIMGDWSRAESYSHDIMENLHNWVGGWIDWNLALDTQGGPNWAHNYVDSPIIVNATADEFYKQPMYYALAHFSKFLQPTSVIIKSHTAMTRKREKKLFFSDLELVAAQRPDGGLVVVALNKGKKDVNLQIVDGRLKRGSFVQTLAAKSLQSFVWW